MIVKIEKQTNKLAQTVSSCHLLNFCDTLQIERHGILYDETSKNNSFISALPFCTCNWSEAFHGQMKVDNLYRHGFQLYEEQIATYLKEHYSGISKIEFSPIFKSGGRGEGFVHARIVPVVYDTYGNKVYLRNDGVLKMGVADYEMTSGIDLDFNVNDGSEIIYLRNNQKESISVESYQNLPDELKLNKDEITDEKMGAFSREGYLKVVEKNSQGSPKAEIVYNLEIRRVDVREVGKWK